MRAACAVQPIVPVPIAFRSLLCLAVCWHAPVVFAQQIQQPATVAEAQPQASDDRGRGVEIEWNDRPAVVFGGTLKLSFKARVQRDFVRSEALDASSGGADVERQRVGIEGSVGKVLEFAVTRELSDPAPWRDAYADYRQFRFARVQAGRFKLPFSLDENTGASNLDFVNRSMAASALAPGRDRGVMLHGRLWRRALSYEAGLFAHDGDNARARDQASSPAGRTTALRVSFDPAHAPGFHAAAAVAANDTPATIWTIRGRTSLDETFFPAMLWVQGRRQRLGVEASWTGGPFSFQSEYMRLTQERLGQGVEDTDLPAVTANGWYMSATWLLTGEQKRRRVQSQAPSVFRGGRGALEAAVRFEELRFGSTAAAGDASLSPRAFTVLGNRDRAMTLGLNWYMSPHLKLLGNLVREALLDPSRGPLPSRPAFWSTVLRLQVGL